MAGIERIKIEDAIISNGDFLPLESILRVGRVQNAIFFNGKGVSAILCKFDFSHQSLVSQDIG